MKHAKTYLIVALAVLACLGPAVATSGTKGATIAGDGDKSATAEKGPRSDGPLPSSLSSNGAVATVQASPTYTCWKQGCNGVSYWWLNICRNPDVCYQTSCSAGRRFIRCGARGICFGGSCHYPRIYTKKDGTYWVNSQGQYYVYCAGVTPPSYLKDQGSWWYYTCSY